jgi:hypothetical protein
MSDLKIVCSTKAAMVEGAIETLQNIFAVARAAAPAKEAVDSADEAQKKEAFRREATKEDRPLMRRMSSMATSGVDRQRRLKMQRESEHNALYVPENHPVLMGDVIVLEDLGTAGFLMGEWIYLLGEASQLAKTPRNSNRVGEAITCLF